MPSPTLPDFQHEIGARMGRGDLAGAALAAASCRTAWPSDPAGWLLGSIVALLADQKETALALVEERLVRDSGNVQCLLQKAECLLALGDYSASLAAAAAAAVHAEDSVVCLDAVGEFLFHAGAYRGALGIYDRAVGAAPADPIIRAKRADVHRVLGNLDLATQDYQAVLAIAPGAPKALKALVELRRQSSDCNSVAPLEAALAAAPADSADAAILHFGLAKSYEDLGDYAQGWRHLQAGNRVERARIDYSPETDRALVDRIIAAFPVLETPRPDTTGVRPIFIVGIPRTGTTLAERIIAGHSQVHPAGEITAMSEAIEVAAGRCPPGTRLGELDGALIACEYLSLVRRGGRPRFTDKLLTNFFHCGLILRAFPNASIIHLTRHPLAACYAIYRTRFSGTYPFAYDLAEIAEFYLGYRRLMAHWHRVLPDRILDVAYEDIVTSLEPAARRMLEYSGLPFEAACLEFHRNPAPVKTTSSVQVRQPLYDSSLHLWRHYAAQLAPLRDRLQAAGIDIE
jgi:tetratricopeptide (TPR) repeat protein